MNNESNDVLFLFNWVDTNQKLKKKALAKATGAKKLLYAVAPAGSIAKRLPDRPDIDPALQPGRIKGIRSALNGQVITLWPQMVPYTATQLANQLPLDRSIGIVRQRLSDLPSVKVLGLGANTKSKEMGSGVPFAEAFANRGIITTTGNSYTVISSFEQLIEIVALCYRDPTNREVAVIGATGSTGRALSLLLSRFFAKVLVVARGQKALDELRSQIGPHKCESVSVDEACRRARFIVTVSGSSDYLDIKPEYFEGKPTWILDVARPRDISIHIARQPNVFVLDGAIVKIPNLNWDSTFDFNFEPKTTYACMAEAMLQGMILNPDLASLGAELDIDKVVEVGKRAHAHGFSIAGVRYREHPVPQEKIFEFAEKFKGGAF